MKKLLALLLIVACSLTARAAEVDFTGKWEVESEVVGNVNTQALTISREGDKIVGVMAGPEGQSFKCTVKVDGKKIVWSHDADWEGNPLTMTYTGEIDDHGVINGTSEVMPMGIEGSFVAKRKS